MFLAYFLRDNSRVTACYSVAYVDTGMTLLYVHMRSWSRYKHNYVFINVRGCFLYFDFIFVCVCVDVCVQFLYLHLAERQYLLLP